MHNAHLEPASFSDLGLKSEQLLMSERSPSPSPFPYKVPRFFPALVSFWKNSFVLSVDMSLHGTWGDKDAGNRKQSSFGMGVDITCLVGPHLRTLVEG